ncbi:MAG: inositol monophosphatase family protein [Elusimicrobiota bacterium]
MSLSAAEIRELLDTAVQGTAAAMPVLGTASAAVIESETRHDVKISADRESEGRIREALSQATNFPILGEESGLSGADREDGLRWIIDPLDGTHNYLRGIPLYCISIGLWCGERPVLGVVRDIVRGEIFCGAAEEALSGAWLRPAGEQLRVSGTTAKSRAVLCTGFPAATDFSAPAVSSFIGEVRAFRKVRLLGSAALSLAYVAAGRADAYRENDIRVWDVAAGLAVVLGAGGKIEISPSEKVHCYRVFASNGRLDRDP